MPGKLVSMDDFREWILSTITRLAVVAATIRRPMMGCLFIRRDLFDVIINA